MVGVVLTWARSIEMCEIEPFCVFFGRNRIAFENEELSIHRLKNSFVCNLWFWTKLVVNEGTLLLFSFFDWLGYS